MSGFSKTIESILKSFGKQASKEISQNASKQGLKSSTPAQKQIHKEQRGIYNVTYNGKNATMIYKDIESIDNVIAYEKGTKRKGVAHIRLEHSTDSKQQGYVTPDEVANLGQNIRAYINTYGEPFNDTNKARVYEWEKDGIRFRAVVNDIKKSASSGNSNLPSASEEIITFYSDRNLKNAMEFKNPVLNPNKQKQQNALDFSLESSFNRK